MGAIQTDVAQIRLINTLKNCHFDRREKSAVRLQQMQSRFLPAVEMTGLYGVHITLNRTHHRQMHDPQKSGTVTMSGKPSVNVPPGTLAIVLRQAGLKK